jgi:hypothetical protein
MWKNFPAPGIEENLSCGNIARSSIVVQKNNSYFQVNEGILSAGIKEGLLLYELPL